MAWLLAISINCYWDTKIKINWKESTFLVRCIKWYARDLGKRCIKIFKNIKSSKNDKTLTTKYQTFRINFVLCSNIKISRPTQSELEI